jgi:dephospho-CoA kinase
VHGSLTRTAGRVVVQVWIDGSLRQWQWYSKVFDSIHEQHPLYRIAIFYVYCDEHLVYERAERRAQVTGRHIPREILKESIEETRQSVRQLTPKADYVYALLLRGHQTLSCFLS